ncbi:Reverse transcriptase, partial [Phytophthora palmivora]
MGKSRVVEEEAEKEHLEIVSRIQEQLMKTSDEEMKSHSEMPKDSRNVVTMGVSGDVTLCGPECEPLPTMNLSIRCYEQRGHGFARLVDPLPGAIKLNDGDGSRCIRKETNIIAFLKDDLERFSPKRLKKIAKVADLFALDVRGVLYRLARSTRGRPRDAEDELRLVVPESLREDMLHYAHEDFQGGHQGITRNIEPTRPFEAVSMDFVTHLPESVRGNTFLLLFQDMFSGYVMCKPMASTTAQDVAEAYEESVFRRFGASSANGQQERSVQTVIRSVKAYVAEADQSDWDEHAERLMFALNTSFDATRLDTPFYLVHGWDAQGTVSAMLGPRPSTLPERTAYEWRRKFQRDYSYALACAKELQRKAK